MFYFRLLNFCIPLLVVAPAWARGGGGSNSGSGGLIQLILLPLILLYAAYMNHRLKKKSQECERLLKKIGQREVGWEKETLLRLAGERFLAIQKAWCELDFDTIRRSLKGEARDNFLHRMEKLRQDGQVNHMDELKIEETQLLNVQNFRDDEQDCFTVKFTAKARDYTTDSQGGIFGNNSTKGKRLKKVSDVPVESFTEFWTFEREGNDWVLRELLAAEAWGKVVNRPLIDEQPGLQFA